MRKKKIQQHSVSEDKEAQPIYSTTHELSVEASSALGQNLDVRPANVPHQEGLNPMSPDVRSAYQQSVIQYREVYEMLAK